MDRKKISNIFCKFPQEISGISMEEFHIRIVVEELSDFFTRDIFDNPDIASPDNPNIASPPEKHTQQQQHTKQHMPESIYETIIIQNENKYAVLLQ